MPQILFTLALIAYLFLLRRLIQQRLQVAEVIVTLLLLALAMDNLVLLLGNLAIGSSGYYAASWLRFGAHVVVLPLLMLAALVVAARAGVSWAGHRNASITIWALVAAAILFGIATELVGLKLVEAELLGHLRLVSAATHPPFATIFTNVIVLVFGIFIWRSSGWPWLFAGSLLIFVINGALASSGYGILAGNAAEIAFAVCWVATLIRFPASD